MRRLFKLATLRLAGSASFLAGIGIPLVKAEAAHLPQQQPKNTISPRDLPIYDQPLDSDEYQVVPVDTSGYLYQSVSITRQTIWTFSDSIQGTVDRVKSAYRLIEKTEKDVIAYIKTEEGLYPRVGAITLAGLTGLLLARKGGLFRKIFYSGTLVGATAAVCYPYQAVRITKTEYEALAAFWKDSVGSGVVDRIHDRMNIHKKNDLESKTSSIPAEDASTQMAPSSEPLMTDHGMSNPEDKDMYTTRT